VKHQQHLFALHRRPEEGQKDPPFTQSMCGSLSLHSDRRGALIRTGDRVAFERMHRYENEGKVEGPLHHSQRLPACRLVSRCGPSWTPPPSRIGRPSDGLPGQESHTLKILTVMGQIKRRCGRCCPVLAMQNAGDLGRARQAA
jgi:hypothetical protein